MTDSPQDPLDLRGIEDLPPDDPRVRAAGPGARARLRAYRDFMSPGDAPEGARVDEANVRLGRVLERELGAGPAEATPPAPAARNAEVRSLSARGSRPPIATWRAPALAWAALIVVVGGAWLVTANRRPAAPPALRGSAGSAPASELPAHATVRPGGTLMLEWTPAAEARTYALVFLSPDLAEVAHVGDLREPRLELRAGALPPGLASGQHVLWRVTALRGLDEVARSKTSMIVVP